MSADAKPLQGGMMWLGGLVLALSNFMVVLDTSIANVSVPHIAGSLAISPDQGTWVVTSYSVAEAICVPLTGWLAQRFGAVRVFIFSMIGFAFFSALCGTSVSLTMLVACRVGQGICGGPLIPLTQTLLIQVFPPEKRGAAMGMWAMTTVVAPVAGPLLGGTISDNWSWHWIFFINLPVAAACLAGTWILMRRYETPIKKNRIDIVGLVLLVVWVGALQVMLDTGRDHDWFGSTWIWELAIVAAVGFVAFIIWELTEVQPIVDVRVFRHRGFAAAVAALAFTYGAFFSAVVVTPQWLQGYLGYTASWAGYVLMWQGMFAVVMSPIVGKLTTKIDPRMLVSFGILTLAFATFQRTQWTPDIDYWHLSYPHMLNGLGLPFFFVPLTILSLSSVRPEETASAAGLSSFVRTLAGAVGTSIATTLWFDQEEVTRAHLTDIMKPGIALDQFGMNLSTARAMLEQLVERQAIAIATTHLFEISTLLMIFAAALIWIVPKPKRIASAAGAH
ncbi:DHA2 family efflux MFS transporter permease subunit [Sphingomonas nostoxanthinifaciens]|uniref:DHA2 family efflux MFS transporter permease subunit n=1 Tax=Sphingomonas nostoxanthinifaciens TaxID=2872652 RepID=UPI001CC20066|nr:DHA2 family efflux MFS transporter permease subunit [Sphingomonas nostoxanthinifaciens]UAK24299.1 DHA2 family efflux MFS transporter permease subunit [Sphingomonas nostoxanthinifaciens]